MRWGIHSDSSIDHSAEDICLEEVENCLDTSVGPCFVALLSHRYGNRHLPKSISIEEFELISSEMHTLGLDLTYTYETKTGQSVQINDIANHCYKIDENEVPRRYKLLRLDRIFESYDLTVSLQCSE